LRNVVNIMSNGGLFTSIKIEIACAEKLVDYFGFELFDIEINIGTIYSYKI